MSSNRSGKWFVFVVVWLVILGGGAAAYKFFFDPGSTGGGGVTGGTALRLPYILWGGDVATFHANGGAKTQKGTLFAKHGLNIELVRHDGDSFDKQVEEYLANKSPFLRGTMSMLGQASEKIAKDENTRPVVFLQMTWSAGDHLVARSSMRTLADLRGKTIALQEGGPHVGMLHDILTTARLRWSKNAAGQIEGDINVVWTPDITGPKGPAELLKRRPDIDACFAITPDMLDLTGDPDQKKPASVAGAHVLVSTQQMSRSIADVYACRKDFYDSNKDAIEKFAAAYLKACEELVEMKKRNSPQYQQIQQLAMKMYGSDIPSEADAKGLIEDAVFAGLPGNRTFFTQKGNLSGFDAKLKAAQDVAIALRDASRRYAFDQPKFDYNKLKELGDLNARPARQPFPDKLDFLPNGTIYSFQVYFKPRQPGFPADQYADDFQRALEQASLFGNAAIELRGHADAVSVLAMFCDAGVKRKLLTVEGDKVYDIPFPTDPTMKIPVHRACRLNIGRRLDLMLPATTKEVIKLTQDDTSEDYADVRQQTKKLLEFSHERAEKVKKAIQDYAEDQAIRMDITQIRAAGIGVAEPVVPIPTDERDYPLNRRVELRIARVAQVAANDFDD